jgi:spermidine/putrescine transport system permease protein
MKRTNSSVILGRVFLAAAILFIMGPIFVTIAFSFNLDRFASLPWKGFTLQWYQKVLTNGKILESLLNSVVLGICVSLTSVILGFAGAFGLRDWISRLKGAFLLLSLSPLLVPWTLLGLALLIFFNKAGIPKSLITVWISHTVFTAPLALTIINARMQAIPKSMDDAAWDMGAGDLRTMFCVLLPQTIPAIAAAALMTFTISFDEFIIAWFVCGFDKTLPVYIYSVIRSGVNPTINAIGTIVFIFSLCLISLAQFLQRRESK